MALWQSMRGGRRSEAGAWARADDAPTTVSLDDDLAVDLDSAASVIDLTDAAVGWTQRIDVDRADARERAERRRERAARAEALEDLARLRARHWSGERVIEEGRTSLEWWAHPDADPFAVLGLLPGAPLTEAAAARRRVAMACHPDRVADGDDPDVALRRMVAANAAYDRLRRALRTTA